MPGVHMPSAEELENQAPDYQLLPEDEFLATIDSYEEVKDAPDTFSKTPGATRDYFIFKLRPITFASGESLEDSEGNPWTEEDKLLFAFIDPKRVGMIPQPSKARKFFAASLGQPIGDTIDIDDYDDLLGKQIIVAVGFSKDKSQNRATDYRPVKIQRRKKAESVQDSVEDDSLPF